MNIISSSSHALYFFRETLVTSLTSNQKKILAIASLVFSYLALCYLVYHQLNKKIEPLTDNVSIDEQDKNLPDTETNQAEQDNVIYIENISDFEGKHYVSYSSPNQRPFLPPSIGYSFSYQI